MELDSAQPIIASEPKTDFAQPIEDQVMKASKQKKNFTKIFLLVLAIAVPLVVGFFVYQNMQLKKEISNLQALPTPTISPVAKSLPTNSPVVESVPAEIAAIFAAVNKDLSASIKPIAEDQFYSLQDMLDKKSWKLDLTSVLKDKPQYAIFRNTLERELMIDNAKGADGPGMSVQGYDNDKIECFMITGKSSYLTCALK